jgi:hypothetical protein
MNCRKRPHDAPAAQGGAPTTNARDAEVEKLTKAVYGNKPMRCDHYGAEWALVIVYGRRGIERGACA